MGEEQEEKCTFVFCFKWVWNSVPHCKGRTQTRISENKLIRDFDLDEMKYQRNEELHKMLYQIKLSLCLGSTLLRHMKGITIKFPILHTSISSNCWLRPVTGNNSLGLYWNCGMLYLAMKVYFHSKLRMIKLHFKLAYDKISNMYKNYAFWLHSWMMTRYSRWKRQWMVNVINIIWDCYSYLAKFKLLIITTSNNWGHYVLAAFTNRMTGASE
jgi:hypothetical protein